MAKLSWGFWTQSKLEILEDYLAAFLTASSVKATVLAGTAVRGEFVSARYLPRGLRRRSVRTRLRR